MDVLGRSPEQERRMLDAARQVADFAYKQGVGDVLAVDDLIRDYARLSTIHRGAVKARDELEELVVAFCQAVGEPIPVDAIERARQLRIAATGGRSDAPLANDEMEARP